MKTKSFNPDEVTSPEIHTIDYKSLYESEAEKLTKAVNEKNEWEKMARLYSEKFAHALKGFLIIQGASEAQAESEKQRIINSVKV